MYKRIFILVFKIFLSLKQSTKCYNIIHTYTKENNLIALPGKNNFYLAAELKVKFISSYTLN